MTERPTLWQAMKSWRTGSISLLSLASGIPLGLVWIAMPDWLRKSGVDIRVIGLISLAQAPWTFKILWAPFIDRYSLPWLGRRRGWVALMQVVLAVLLLCLAGVGDQPETPWVVFALALAMAFSAATYDIAYDAYAVDLLRPEEQGLAVGGRTALYRVGMQLAGAWGISLAALWSWPAVDIILAALVLLSLLVIWKAPEPEAPARVPRTLREAVWLPFLGFLSRHRALEILALVFFYKFADNMAFALLRPFLLDMGYSDADRGVLLGTVAIFATIIGTFAGGMLTTMLGLGHALWLFGFLQIFSNLGYVAVARSEPNSLLMLGAGALDNLASGLGNGAFAVMLLRLTQKRFSATQYALFSSLFSLPRVLTGPITGLMVDALGWETFYWVTLVTGIPGLVLLARFVPPGVREPRLEIVPPRRGMPLAPAALALRGLTGGVLALAIGAACMAAVAALKAMRSNPAGGFDLPVALASLLSPSGPGEWLQLAAILSFAVVIGLLTAAVAAARHGALHDPSPPPA